MSGSEIKDSKRIIEMLTKNGIFNSSLVNIDGEPIPAHWPLFQIGEQIVIKNYTFRIGYINKNTIVLEPIGIWEPEKDE